MPPRPPHEASGPRSFPNLTAGRPAGRLTLRLRPRWAPPFWRMVDDGRPARTFAQQSQWALVLQSRDIPHAQVKKGQRSHFYVPALLEIMARRELSDYGRESLPSPPPPPPTLYPHGNLAVLFLVPLLLWHGLRAHWWPLAQTWGTPPDLWSQLGALDVVRVKVYHEWYRAVTALTLHADSQHILGNVAFGSIFLILLCRAQGLGLGLALCVSGGALGNVCNALFRQGAHTSMGFSTALFACVGALSGALMLQNGRQRSKALVPLAAGGAILAMLGTEGERTDYAAHLWGLACGVLLGMAAQAWRHRHGVRPWMQWAAGLAAAAVLLGCWWLAGLRI